MSVLFYQAELKKYKNAARELAWQWFFPAKTLIFVAEKNGDVYLHSLEIAPSFLRITKTKSRSHF